MRHSKKLHRIATLGTLIGLAGCTGLVKLTPRNNLQDDIKFGYTVRSQTQKTVEQYNKVICGKVSSAKSDTNNCIKVTGYFPVRGPVGGTVEVVWQQVDGTGPEIKEEPILITRAGSDKDLTAKSAPVAKAEDINSSLLPLVKDLQIENVTRDEFYRIADVADSLGKLHIATIDEDGKIRSVVQTFPLTTLSIRDGNPISEKKRIYTNKEVTAQLRVSAAIFGSIDSKVSAGDLYEMAWEISHFQFKNSIDIVPEIGKLTNEERKLLRSALALAPSGAFVFTFRSMHVIDEGHFSITKGHGVDVSAAAAVGGVFTASGSYVFRAEESQHVNFGGHCYNLAYSASFTAAELFQSIDKDGHFDAAAAKAAITSEGKKIEKDGIHQILELPPGPEK